MDTGQWIVILLSALFMIWFLSGTAVNRRLGDQVLRWVQAGSKQFGRLSAANRIRGSAVQLSMKDVAAPFRRLDLIVALEPRENPPFWLYHHLDGKRDELLIQGTLRSAPKQEFELTKHRPGRSTVQDETKASIPERLQAPSGTFTLTQSQGKDPALLDRLEQFLSKHSAAVQRLILKRSVPHFYIQLRLVPLLETDPEEFIEDLERLFA
jgi:hypothetical protein